MKKFKSWKITDTVSNNELLNMSSIKLISLLEFIKEHTIRPSDFTSITNKLQELYTLCNITTLQRSWELKNDGLLSEWNGTILFLGTRIELEVCKSLDVECYPALGIKMYNQEDRFKLVTPIDISRYELIGRKNYHVAVF